MFAQIYFGVISSTLLSSSQRIRGVFQKHIYFSSLSFNPSASSYCLSFCSSFFLGFNMDFLCHDEEKASYGQSMVDMLHCHSDSWLSQHSFKLQTRAAATDIETSVNQVSTKDLCSMQNSGLPIMFYTWDRIFAKKQRERNGQLLKIRGGISMLVAVKTFSLNSLPPLCKVSIIIPILHQYTEAY